MKMYISASKRRLTSIVRFIIKTDNMNKREAKFTTKLQKWMAWKIKNGWKLSHSWEVKVVDTTKSPNYAYNSDKSFKKEMRNLLIGYSITKHSDLGGFGTKFDGDTVIGDGYFYIHFQRRGNKRFYMIRADNLNDFILETNPKSITEEDCKHLGVIGDLK